MSRKKKPKNIDIPIVSPQVEVVNKNEPTPREQLIWQWKCYMNPSSGDLGKAALIKKQLEKDKPLPIVESNIESAKEEVIEKPIETKRGKKKK